MPDKKLMKILVVDDQSENIDILIALLKDNYKVVATRNGKAALRMAFSRKPPDLILLDILMPEMDGYMVCEQLKANKSTQDIPVIFVTAVSEVMDQNRAFDVGGIDYITKPFHPPIVRSKVKTHIQLRSYINQLQELNEQKNKFLGMAAHDLRNPLSGIRGFAQYMAKDIDDMPKDKIKRYLNFITGCCDDMLSIVNDFLTVSIIESGNLELRPKAGSLKKLIEDRIRLNKILADEKKINFTTEFKTIPDAYFDPVRIAQVLDNLVGNAIKFSPPDSIIRVILEQEGALAKISVQDEGPGIDFAQTTDLFKYFHVGGTRTTGGETSTGLGLAIVKRVVEAHGGKIEVHNLSPKGTLFTFTTPLDAHSNRFLEIA